MIPLKTPAGTPMNPIFRLLLNAEFDAFLSEHVVGGRTIVPGSAFLELARAAVSTTSQTPCFALKQVFFLSPLMACPITEDIIEISLDLESSSFEFYSGDHGRRVVHCAGGYGDDLTSKVDFHSWRNVCDQVVDVTRFYAGLDYGAGYQTIRQAWVKENVSALGVLKRHKISSGLPLHPAELDGPLQLSALVPPEEDPLLLFAIESAVIVSKAQAGLLWTVRSHNIPPVLSAPGHQTPCVQHLHPRSSLSQRRVFVQPETTSSGALAGRDPAGSERHKRVVSYGTQS